MVLGKNGVSPTLLLLALVAGMAAGYAGPGVMGAQYSWPLPLAWIAMALFGFALWAVTATLKWRWAWLAPPLVMLALGLARGSAAVHQPGPQTVDGHIGEVVRVEGDVDSVSAPLSGAGGSTASQQQRFRFRVDRLTGFGRAHRVEGLVLVQVHGQAQVWPGQRLSLQGRLAWLRRLGPGGVAGYADRLERQGVEAELSATSMVALSPPPRLSIVRAVEAMRQGLARVCRDALPEPEASIVLGEAAGIRGRLPAAVDSDLVDSGLVHVLAISGIKVAIVSGVLQMLTVALGGRRAAFGAIGGIGVYTLVGGATASAIRSATMGSLAMVARSLRRDPEVLRSLLLAAGLMLAWRPSLVVDLSFQYSFLGVLGIHLFAAPFGQKLSAIPRPFREALAVTAAAQLATLPLTAHYFQVIPVLAPVANAVVLPTLPVSIVAGILLGIVGTFGRGVGAFSAPGSGLLLAIQVALATVVFWLARLAIGVGHLTAHLPGAVFRSANFGGVQTFAYYAGLAASVAASRRYRASAAIAAGSALGMLALLVLGRPDGHLHVSFLNGGGGPSVLLVAADGATMLVDTGSQAAALASAIDTSLPPGLPVPGRRRIGALLLTGGSHAEAGGLAALDAFTIPIVVAPERLSGGAATQAVSALARRGAAVTWMAPGDVLRWHGLDLQLAPAASQATSLIISDGAARIAVVEASGTEPPVVPAGDYTVLDIGQGTVGPELQGVAARLALAQDSAGKPVARSVRAAFGQALWQSSRDGRLDLTCDARRCWW